MKTSQQFKPESAFALLLVGEPKSGKTNVAMSFPNPWFLNIDRNISRAAEMAKDKTWFWDDPYTDDNEKEVPEVGRWNRAMELIKKAALSPDVHTMVIDGGGSLVDMLMAHIVNEGKKVESRKNDNMQIQDYGSLAIMLTKLAVLLRGCGKMVIFTFHQKVDKDELTGRTRFELNMPGKLANSYGGLFTDVWACTANNAGPGKFKYEIHTKPTGYHITLGTSKDLPPVIDVTDKTPQQIWAVIGPKIKP